MYRVNNQRAVRRLADRSFRASRSRNIIAVLAIALTALLFTALFTVGSGLIENIQRQTMRQAGGDGMAVLKYVTDGQYEQVKDHPLIKEISYNRILSSSVDNEELLKRHGELYYMDETGIRLGFCEPVEGTVPQAEDDLMMDTKTAKLLGVELTVGSPVSLKLTVHGQQVTRMFRLCGWWEADPVFNVSILVTSRAYVDAHMEELYNSYKEDYDVTGAINCYIMFGSSGGLERKLQQVITESGFPLDETDPDYIDHNVNWSYLSAGMDANPETVAGVAVLVLLITLAGYLIIYNIFQISVLRDIRFYGLLKTIGTTGRQIRTIIRRQALFLSCMGIPLGLILGWLTGCALVPLMLAQSLGGAGFVRTTADPRIFAGSVLFALATVFISTAKPGRIAAKVSPVEAVRYTDNDSQVKKGRRKSGRGAKMTGMALANLGRNRKRTTLVIISMSLSLVLFNTLYTFSIGFDMDKYLAKFVDTDFLTGHADYFNYQYAGPDNSMSESMIQAIEQEPEFLEGGRLYANIRDTEFFDTILPAGMTTDQGRNPDTGGVGSAVYGLEELPLSRLDVVEGEIDPEKLRSGHYILEGVPEDDDGRILWDRARFDVGEKVTLVNYRGDSESRLENERMEREFEIMAKVRMKHYTNTCMVGWDFSWYLPAEVYKEMVAEPGIMSYAFNVREGGEKEMGAFLLNYTENVEPLMNYSSKSIREAEFAGMKNMVLAVGGALSLVIGMIGILNFVNSMMTSILTRRREFAMLQSIGMTGKQLLQMLMTEGVWYGAASGLVSLVLGVVLSLLAVRNLAGSLWFFSYHFTVLPLVLTVPVLLAVGILLPAVMLRSVERQSVVERLREAEG
ncbi:MAG: ABC transporter permease [Lachnospiraceae bacterium]|jgi:putative ABC transport system permease protein|nr:ABC transporter permease [Lachnospiraceae bacterium]